MRSRTLRTVAIALVALVLLLVGRGLLEGRAAVRRAQELDAHGDVDGAIAHAMRAAKWYVPLSSHPREAYDLLRTIARRAEANGDADTALIAWQAIRAGVRATRSVYVPYEDRLAEADKEIAILLSSKPPPGIDRDKTREQIFEEHRALLARDDAPKPFAVVALYGGLAIWALGIYRLSMLFDGDRARRARPALATLAVPIALAIVGIAVFLVSLSRA